MRAVFCVRHETAILPDITGTMHSTSQLLTPAPVRQPTVRQRLLGSRAWLAACLAVSFDGKTVVVTHHLPAQKSVALL